MNNHYLDRVGRFVRQLSEMHFAGSFNPYSDHCDHSDAPSASSIRRDNLSMALDSAIRRGVHSIWIGRDLGYRGGRRTGLPFTDDKSLRFWKQLLDISPQRATTGPEVNEKSASTVWPVALGLNTQIFLWNAFPFHPFEPGNPFSNRCHTRLEADSCAFTLHWLLENLRPARVIAIGLDSSKALARARINHAMVRHPSYGGQAKFRAGIKQLYGVS